MLRRKSPSQLLGMKDSSKTIKLLNERYNRIKKSLNLEQCHGAWRNVVIMFRDWDVLKYLDLVNCDLDDSGAKMLSNMDADWPHLQELHFGNNDIRNFRLKQLGLSETGISVKGLKDILNQQFPKLKSLISYNNCIGDEGLVLVLNKQLPCLQKLILRGSRITSVGLRSLPDAQFQNIKMLCLSKNSIGSRGVQLLVKAQMFHLRKLSLFWCRLGTEGWRQLSKGDWPLLIQLCILTEVPVAYDGFASIVENNWQQLQKIDINERGLKECNDDSISLLCLTRVNWPQDVDIRYNPTMGQRIDSIIYDKFPLTPAFDDDQ